MKLKWITELYVRAKSIKFVEENIGKNIFVTLDWAFS